MVSWSPFSRPSPFYNPSPAIPPGLPRSKLQRHRFLSNRWGNELYEAARPSAGQLPQRPQFRSQRTEKKVAIPKPLSRRSADETTNRTGQSPQSGKQGDPEWWEGLVKTRESRRGRDDAQTKAPREKLRVLPKFTDLLKTALPGTDEAGNAEVVTPSGEPPGLGSFTSQQQQYLEISKLQREREADQKRLKELQSELVISNMQIDRSVQQLAEAKLALEEEQQKRMPQKTNQPSLEQPPRGRAVATMPSGVLVNSREGKQAVTLAFQKLRTTILKFAGSSAVQLGPLPPNLVDVDNLLQPQEWNRANAGQRRYRIMAKIFQLLYRRIFRPGLRIFGVQAFLRSGISASEAYLRALEKDLEAKGVTSAKLDHWIATTITTTTPLRDIPKGVEGLAQELFDALRPVIRFAFRRNSDSVHTQIATICIQAVELKLTMRRAGSRYRIEVPSRDTKRWGEPGYDDLTGGLPPVAWLTVVDREPLRQPGGNVVYVPFGALTGVGEWAGGEKAKMVFERGDLKLKRKIVEVEETEDVEGPPRKRASLDKATQG
ncbi:uncharacterized protein C8A04DRAFT_38223 [Dichotomopilus funicola]|uniref:Uncharacterized protein n=1 Tax=Dichotomopilus funicola TaxID=1934379 RepID=A0AAN6V164_9PEZI|nr:hypothetical protein C8A04DRAFT_38223 [Dichotomopilus funicola]